MGQVPSSFSSGSVNDDNSEGFYSESLRQETHNLSGSSLRSTASDPGVGPSDSLREARNRFMRNRQATAVAENEYSGREVAAPCDANAPSDFETFTPEYGWMWRSIESLVLGHMSSATATMSPIADDVDVENISHDAQVLMRSSVSTQDSLDLLSRQSTLDFSVRRPHGRNPANHQSGESGVARAMRQRRSCESSNPALTGKNSEAANTRGTAPNIVLSLLAREATGRSPSSSLAPAARLHQLGGKALFQHLDSPAGGIVTEIKCLHNAMDRGDWAETCNIVSRLAPRLLGDPMRSFSSSSIDDPTLPRFASPHLAGGGRLGVERDAFVLGGGVQLYLRIFLDASFVGNDVRNDARRLTPTMVTNKLASCWNEVLVSLRELVYSMPILVEDGTILDGGRFIPFLFTVLYHDSCFDSAAALIEEILSALSHSSPVPFPPDETPIDGAYRTATFALPVSTFFLGNVPNLYSLWHTFSCRQLAHFCRILALLIFEPEDRQLLESQTALKSLELLQLRRDRAARAGRDATVDMNQSILLGDKIIMQRLLRLLKIMNYAPMLRQSSAYHVMAHFPFIAETLIMLGLSEMDNWGDVNRLDLLAKTLMRNSGEPKNVSELGAVAGMLESLAGSFQGDSFAPATQLGQIIHVINAAQQAGIVVGRRGRRQREGENGSSIHVLSVPLEDTSLNDLSTLTDHLSRRRTSSVSDESNLIFNIEVEEGESDRQNQSHRRSYSSPSRMRISSPQDAANELQFNALLLAPYQVEVLLVLCTLLGGRRKIDAQRFLNDHGLIPIMDEMLPRLSFGATLRNAHPPGPVAIPRAASAGNVNAPGEQEPEVFAGIHGPGCECTPESALRVQYLRLLHNFCDRDCDNYIGRRQLLSNDEREYVFSDRVWQDAQHPENLRPGLFSKLIQAFSQEPDDSPYRFWLASCAESYLRGSSAHEQLFAAKSGLLSYLVQDIVSDRLHCAGSLQTSFDLLGEVCKGNSEVLYLLVSTLNEVNFRKLMSAAAANLVDSNVFLRTLLLTVERISAARIYKLAGQPKLGDPWKGHQYGPWTGHSGEGTRYYLTHSWWDASIVPLERIPPKVPSFKASLEDIYDDARSSDWFPPGCCVDGETSLGDNSAPAEISPIDAGIGYNGWQFTPPAAHRSADGDAMGWALGDAVFLPNTIERLAWFLITNQSRLLRDLLDVVDLKNIDHENICCLNTAVVVSMLASRRRQLSGVIRELRRLDTIEKDAVSRGHEVGREREALLSASMNQLEIDDRKVAPFERYRGLSSILGDHADILHNFRELLWFWSEYYTHRGRDRLSLEFSSHMRFEEWFTVVSTLSADDGSSTALVRRPPRMPRSPYQRAPRIVDSPRRTA
ncbi:hair follicle maturation [Fragilaria crotonensis]|nr:hair follicle maturation [Fragilaria crotonensis]